MITVTYPPGSVDPVHRHHAHAFVYLLKGFIAMQVPEGREVMLTPGQTFYEGPNDVHAVGLQRNHLVRLVAQSRQRRVAALVFWLIRSGSRQTHHCDFEARLKHTDGRILDRDHRLIPATFWRPVC